MVAWKYVISLLELNTRREIPYLRAPMDSLYFGSANSPSTLSLLLEGCRFLVVAIVGTLQ